MAVYVPEGYEDAVMDAVDAAIESIYPGYRRTFSITEVTGTWVPTEGSDPFLGTHGKIETAKERKIEFAVYGEDLQKAVAAIRKVHPYEEPAIDVFPMVAWKSLL